MSLGGALVKGDHAFGDAAVVHVLEGLAQLVQRVRLGDHLVQQQVALGVKLQQPRQVDLRQATLTIWF